MQPIYCIATYQEWCLRSGDVAHHYSTGPGLTGEVDEECDDVQYHKGSRDDLIREHRHMLRVLQTRHANGWAPGHFLKRTSEAVLDVLGADAEEDS